MKREKMESKASCGGQSIVEYIIFVGVIISLLIIFLRPGGYFEQMYQRTLRQQGDDMLDAARVIFRP